MRRSLLVSFRMALVTIVVLGVAYPLVVWGVSALVFREQSSGSMVRAGGNVVGSRLIGQSFESPEYFHGRPSAAGAGYDPLASGASNLGPTSAKLVSSVKQRVIALGASGSPTPGGGVPIDLVTASASGLDPHISPDAAYLQVARVASTRGMREDVLRALVAQHVDGRQLGLLGEPRVNVLELNLALDEVDGR